MPYRFVLVKFPLNVTLLRLVQCGGASVCTEHDGHCLCASRHKELRSVPISSPSVKICGITNKIYTQTVHFAPVPLPGELDKTCVVFHAILFPASHEKNNTIKKTELHKLALFRDRRTKPSTHVTCAENFDVWLLRCARGHADKQTYRSQ